MLGFTSVLTPSEWFDTPFKRVFTPFNKPKFSIDEYGDAFAQFYVEPTEWFYTFPKRTPITLTPHFREPKFSDTELSLKQEIDALNPLKGECGDVLERAYMLPKFRHKVRAIVKDIFDAEEALELEHSYYKPKVLLIAYDIPQLRAKVISLVEKKFEETKESGVDPIILQLAFQIPALRPDASSVIEESLKSAHCNPTILQLALDVPVWSQNALAIITVLLRTSNVKSEILQIAYDVPELRESVISIVEKNLSSNDPAILGIAIKEKSLRDKAKDRVKQLLPSHDPKILHLALQLGI